METPGLRWIILRPGVVYGPGDRALLPLFKLAERGLLPLVGRADAAYTFVHVHDVVRTIAAAVDAAADSEILFVGHPHPVTAREILDVIRLVIGRPALVMPVPLVITRMAAAGCDLLARVVGRPLPLTRWRYVELSAGGFVCQVGRLRERLGIVAELDLREGLADTAAWYRREGWIKSPG
jgi:nucleoside-diphosphate-sugar epimerase